jgi:site-specific DNA recombinase
LILRIGPGGYRRALARRVEVDAKEVRIMGVQKRIAARTLVVTSSAKIAGFGVPGFVPKWCAKQDSNRH